MSSAATCNTQFPGNETSLQKIPRYTSQESLMLRHRVQPIK